MVDFRKGLLLLAGLVVTTGLASAQALNPIVCTAMATATPVIRSEGVAEPVAPVLLDCTGGTPVTDPNAVLPTVNISVFYAAPVTSRLLTPATNASEGLLVVDQPSVDDVKACMVGTVCPTTLNNLSNVYQATQSSSGFSWSGVVINPPGTTGGHRYLRILNARVNATGVTGPIAATVLVTSNNTTSSVQVVSTNMNVGYPQSGLTVSASTDTVPTVPQCGAGTGTFTVNFKEGFSAAFRTKSPAAPAPATWYSTDFTSESTVAAPLPGALSAAGIANTGTRLIATFANIPANVTLSVPARVSVTGAQATLVSGASAAGVGGSIVTDTSTPVKPTITSGTAFVVYEVTSTDPAFISTLGLDVTVAAVDGTTPALGTITVVGSFGPVTSATSTAAPRFMAPSATPFNGITLSPCTTSLLFPFVTNAAGFDTGIAIANTSSDPTSADDNGTVPQAGTVTFYYYGPSAPAAQTSGNVAAGSVLSFSLSSGIAGTGVAGAPGFTGYMIAQCNFRLAHGYAFISDAGAQKLAQGYLALVLPSDTSRNGASTSEALNQ